MQITVKVFVFLGVNIVQIDPFSIIIICIFESMCINAYAYKFANYKLLLLLGTVIEFM